MALFEWLLIANVTVAMHQQDHRLLARLCLNYFRKEHKKPESKAKSSYTNGYTLVWSYQRIPHPEKYVYKKVWLEHEWKKNHILTFWILFNAIASMAMLGSLSANS